jgi:predicted Zn-dependent peptidase
MIDEVLWPDQPLGRDIGGTKESLAGITREMMIDYMRAHYVPRATVVVACGNIGHQEIVDRIERRMGDWSGPLPGGLIPAQNGQYAPRSQLKFRKTEQAHLCLAVPGVASDHPDRYPLDLLNVMLGEGMSSRLFLQLRERRALAYDIYSYVSHFLDAGALTVYAGVEPKRVDETIRGILEELDRAKGEIPQEELRKVKEYTKGRLLLRMEDTRSVASWVGTQELLRGRIRSVDEVVEIIDSITAEDLQWVARELFVTEKLNLAIVGPVRREERISALLRV